MVVQTYTEAFWGVSLSSTAGYEALVKRNQGGKKICQELEEYLKKRSKLESDYSKTLSSLSKCFKVREPVGILEETLNMLKVEVETMANSHQGASVFFSQQGDQVKRFRDEQNSRKKQKEEVVQKVQSAKLSQLSKALQYEKSYYKRCTERDITEAVARDADAENPPPPQKELEKVRNKAIKAQEEVQKADTSYRGAVLVLEDNRVNWEREMASLCELSQGLDEERIRYLREEIWTCLNVDSKLALDVDNSCESVRLKLENCSISNDTQRFIEAATTGSVRPEPFRYKPYIQKQAQARTSEDDSNNPYVDIDVILRRKEQSQRK